MSEIVLPRHGVRYQAGLKLWSAFESSLGFEVSSDSSEYISQANTHLRDAAVGVFVNHQRIADTPIAISFLLAHLPSAGDMMGPAGMKHFDFKRDPFSAAVFRMLPPIGIRPVPVVQDGDSQNYSERERQDMLDRLKAKASAAIVSPGGIYGIAPEGTRSHDGTLQSSKRGLGYLPGYDPEGRLLYVPVGIIYKNEHLGTEQNEIRVGEPFRFTQLGLNTNQLPEDKKNRAQLIANTMMYRLAEILPETMRGEYALI